MEVLPEDWERALAVVAHPDDLEYGVASAIARWTGQGKWIGYVLATRGEAGIDGMHPSESGPLRAEEERRSAAAVGVDVVEFLGHPDGVLTYGLDLRRDIARAIRRHRPDALISINHRESWGGRSHNMADHRVLGEALVDAARDAGNRWVFPELLEEGHEPWGGVKLVAFGASPDPSHGTDVTDTIDRGVASLREHAAYLEAVGGPDPDAMLRGAAESAGKQLGCAYAVTFEVIEL